MFDSSACDVVRTANGDYRVRWRTSHPGQRISIYMADVPETFDAWSRPAAPIGESTGEEALIPNPDPTTRHYFYLESEHGDSIVLAERRLALEGTPNFRDLGGYPTREGRRLKWGKLYRSGRLSALTAADHAYFRRLGITLICDFRQTSEQQMEPTLLGDDVQHVLASLPVAPGSSQSFLENLYHGILAVRDSASFMEEVNRDFVVSALPQFAEMFRLLLTNEPPFVIHCASGKDRTGFGSALILDVLGVEENVIVEDYLLTNDFLPVDAEMERLSRDLKDQTGARVSEEVLRPLLELRPEYLMACFDEIRTQYDSREHFHSSALGLDEDKIATLKKRLLQP